MVSTRLDSNRIVAFFSTVCQFALRQFALNHPKTILIWFEIYGISHIQFTITGKIVIFPFILGS